MANNYYEATGVLMLEDVTPVISALFGAFNLDANYLGNGRAFIATIAETNDPQWSDVLEGLTNLSTQLNISPGEEPETTIDVVLEALARHFHADQDEDLENLIEHHPFDGDADLEALFLIASCFNDGHNFIAIQFEGCWYCSKPRLFELGGHACFISREIRLFGNSAQALELATDLQKALREGDLTVATARITLKTARLLAGVQDHNSRRELRQRIAEGLLQNQD
ncbi:hypothetical protein RS584_14800 [Enterobacter sp. DTU_2021_1002640_1_SI_PRY_ASU_LCPMC_013]|uniref:hypothetical protein n=1 Tax=Enterobacter sp. DTU_2021_1002640_1_SI_PRY_ASU_LCPMC_013 TaxID=3077940 RepID=UPI0028EDD872|nr:hypothetical protein [Enterobacter sp. DTU_2021_1002640_1_SI_PRY_ASU_LCPMC_013]WNU98983.1 hypothetical protein RS584_14800 [Enterobacter sp. DTU_2021_1002640_1_SI_PRY_ASU_LCPMC_013]